MSEALQKLMEATSFAARAHAGQLRKDGVTPYASHPMRVCLVARLVFGVEDPEVLAAALLHDTIEDTTTDYDDIDARFGAKVAGWVRSLTKDKRLPETEREEAYARELCAGGWAVHVLKLADIYDNLTDSISASPDNCRRTLERTTFYLDRMGPALASEARSAFDIVRRLLDEKRQTH